MSLSIILYIVNRDNTIIHFHDNEFMDPKKCTPFFKIEHTDLAAFYETLERNYPKKLSFNEAVQLQKTLNLNMTRLETLFIIWRLII